MGKGCHLLVQQLSSMCQEPQDVEEKAKDINDNVWWGHMIPAFRRPALFTRWPIKMKGMVVHAVNPSQRG